MPTIFSLVFLTVVTFLVSQPATTQQAKVPRIGYLSGARLSANPEALRQGLRDLGYIEGKNIFIEWRSAEGKLDRLPALAAELVHLQVDAIVTAGATATRPAKSATSTNSIVMAQDDDPVGNGFVASLSRPGGNVTGLSQLSTELSGKRLEILKEIVPNLSRVAVLGTSNSPGNTRAFKEIEIAASVFGLSLQYVDVLTSEAIEPAFSAANKGPTNAVLAMISGPIRSGQQKKIVALAIKSRLPAMHERPEYVEAGGLVSYGVSLPDLYRRAATYVDKILKGAKPADIPVEQATKFVFWIYLKTAKQIGLTIPPNVLARADRVIK